MHTPEWHEKKEICAYLDSIGAWYFKPTTMGFGKSGVGDIIFCYQGRFGSIEVKREGKNPTGLQVKRMVDIRDAGGMAVAGTADVVIAALSQWTQAVWVVAKASEGLFTGRAPASEYAPPAATKRKAR